MLGCMCAAVQLAVTSGTSTATTYEIQPVALILLCNWPPEVFLLARQPEHRPAETASTAPGRTYACATQHVAHSTAARRPLIWRSLRRTTSERAREGRSGPLTEGTSWARSQPACSGASPLDASVRWYTPTVVNGPKSQTLTAPAARRGAAGSGREGQRLAAAVEDAKVRALVAEEVEVAPEVRVNTVSLRRKRVST